MPIDTFEGARAHILQRAVEDTGTDGDFYSLAADALLFSWRDLSTRHPIVEFVSDPPGAGLAEDDITNLTVTIAAAGTSVAATLSAAPSVSVVGYKLRPASKTWVARVTAQTGAALTLDAAPESIVAGTACTLFKDELNLVSDLGVLFEGIWWQDGSLVKLRSPEWLRQHYPDPPSGAVTPKYFCRLTARKIKFSQYPTAVRRFEYPYTYVPADPSGTGEVALPKHWRAAWVNAALAELLDMKFDRRDVKADARAERAVERALAYEQRRWVGLGQLSAPIAGSGTYTS